MDLWTLNLRHLYAMAKIVELGTINAAAGKVNLTQPAITQDTLADYVNPAMPPLHYAMCGCEEMENYPQAWGGN